jgi:hypothetical protein
MGFGGSSGSSGSRSSGGEGVELARGYIALSAKYSPAMRQIANDFRALEDEADKAGTVAGQKLKSGICTGLDNVRRDSRVAGEQIGMGVSQGVKTRVEHSQDGIRSTIRKELHRAGVDVGSDAEAVGTVIGTAVGRGVGRTIAAPFRLMDKAVGSIGSTIKDVVTGPMTKMLGATTALGVAVETLSKGWELDTDIQNTQVQLQAFGGTVQDVAGFMDSVKEATKGTQFGFQDVAETARAFFAEGERGSGLVEKLKQIEDMASATGMGIQGVTNLFEAGIGADVMNPMLLKKLQVAGIPARQELLKALGMPDTEEGNKALDKMLKTGQVQFKTFWDQAAKDAEGTAERMSHTWSGQLHKMGVDIAQIGGDFMKPFLGQGGLEGVNGALEKLDGWVNAHQDTIKGWFDDAKQAAGDLIGVIKGVKGILDDIPGGIKTVAEAFVAWKSISAIASLIESLTTITTLLKALPAVVGVASRGMLAALGPVGAMVGGIALALDKLFSWANGPADVSRLPPILPNTAKLPGGEGRPNTAGAPPTVGGIPIPGLLVPGQSHGAGAFCGPGGQACIQQPVGKAGLIQWAEPETHGEAYIPLAMGKRQRSLEIWRKTGIALGALKSHDDGDFDGGDGMTLPANAGGLQAVYALLGTLTGGTGGSRTPYQLGGFGTGGIDCSGLVASVVNAYLGSPAFGQRMDTGNEQSWLTARGFQPGAGGPSSITVGWNGQHTAMSVGTMNAESTTSNGISGVRVGPMAAGGNDSQFTNRMHLDIGADPGMTSMLGMGMGGRNGQQHSQRERALQDRIARDDKELGDLKAKRDNEKDEKKKASLDKEVSDKEQKLAETKQELAKVRQQQLSSGGLGALFGGKGDKGSGGSSDNPLSELLGIGQKGLKETLSIPGFGDYSSNPFVKSAVAAIGMFTGGGGKGGGGLLGGLLGNMGGFGDVLAHPVRAALGGGKSTAHGYTQAPFGAGEAGPQVMPGGKLAPSGGGGSGGFAPPVGSPMGGGSGDGGGGNGMQVNIGTVGASQKDVQTVMSDVNTQRIRTNGAAHSTINVAAPGSPG